VHLLVGVARIQEALGNLSLSAKYYKASYHFRLLIIFYTTILLFFFKKFIAILLPGGGEGVNFNRP
jgi:hypothetical protein